MNYRYFVTLALVLSTLCLAGQDSPPDSLRLYALPDVQITGFRDDTVARRVAASVSALGPAAIAQFGGESLLPALNRLAGVRFEQRAPGLLPHLGAGQYPQVSIWRTQHQDLLEWHPPHPTGRGYTT